MEKEPDSWFPDQQYELPPSYANISGSPALRGQLPALMNAYTKGVCAKGTIPMAPYSGLPLSEVRQQPIGQYNWLYGIPCFKQTFASPLAKEKFASDKIDNNGCGKRFLVFDKSGDQTSLIYSSGIRTPINGLTSFNLEPRTSVGVIKEELLCKDIVNPKVSTFQNLDGYNQEYYPKDVMKNQSFDGIQCVSPSMIAPEGAIEDEMHENTEELNALLYSDDENDYSNDNNDDDDEVTSTGHSPSTMIDQAIHNLAEDEDDDYEEVASSACSFKRYKLLDGAYDVPPLVHVSTIKKKPSKSSDLDNDAESYCSNFDNQLSGDSSMSGKKRSRQSENIRTKLSILQNIIPGTKGKNPTAVIDEAVQYLKFLKDKVKSFGLDSP